MSNIDNIMKLLQESHLELKLDKILKDVETEMVTNEIFMDYVDFTYEDTLRDLDLIKQVRDKMLTLTQLCTAVSDIEQEAIVNKSMDLMWRCESIKARMMNQMTLLREKYDL